MDRFEAMSLLIKSVEAGSFSAASRKLGTPLPTISRKISELEAHLKTRLLVRSTRKLTLTDAGAAYVAASRRILEQVGDAETQASGEYAAPRGELIVTAPVAFGRIHFLSIINDFLADYPDINVRMTLSDRYVNLAEDHIDLAVRIGALPDSSMIATSLGTVRRVVCGSPAYFAAHGIPEALSDLAKLTCVTLATLASGPSWSFASGGKAMIQGPRPRCRLNVNSAEAALDAAIAGLGITHLLSYHVAHAVEQGLLRVVLAGHEPAPLPVHLIHAGQGLLPLKMRSFLEFAAPRLRKALLADQKMLDDGITKSPAAGAPASRPQKRARAKAG